MAELFESRISMTANRSLRCVMLLCSVQLGTVLPVGASPQLTSKPAATPNARPKASVPAQVGAQAPPQPAHKFALTRAQSKMQFNFVQAGAKTTGEFKEFASTLTCAANNTVCSLAVSVTTASVDTKDKDRDALLRSPLLFDSAHFPLARFVSSGVQPQSASGKLTLRDQSRSVRIPLTLRFTAEAGHSAAYLDGEFAVNRLDYGIGQGEWASTEWVANSVIVRFTLRLDATP